jgi:hypothetical protein
MDTSEVPADVAPPSNNAGLTPLSKSSRPTSRIFMKFARGSSGTCGTFAERRCCGTASPLPFGRRRRLA